MPALRILYKSYFPSKWEEAGLVIIDGELPEDVDLTRYHNVIVIKREGSRWVWRDYITGRQGVENELIKALTNALLHARDTYSYDGIVYTPRTKDEAIIYAIGYATRTIQYVEALRRVAATQHA